MPSNIPRLEVSQSPDFGSGDRCHHAIRVAFFDWGSVVRLFTVLGDALRKSHARRQYLLQNEDILLFVERVLISATLQCFDNHL
jgi:hypothetical protein